MRAALKKASLLLLGWAFVVLGIAGLFLPILQGILFILIGLIILSNEYVWAHKLLHRLRTRFPSVACKADEASLRAGLWMRRVLRLGTPH